MIPYARGDARRGDCVREGRESSASRLPSFNVIEMPEYARGVAVAYADMPGRVRTGPARLFTT